MAKRFKIHNAILCDNVVPGAYGKQTLVNIYSGDIIIAELPANLLLGLYLELDAATAPNQMTVDVQIEGQTAVRFAAQFQTESIAGNSSVNLSIPLFQVRFEKDSTLEVILTSHGYDRAVALRKKVSKGAVPGFTPPPNASPPPSEQSRPASRRTKRLL